MTIDAKNCTDMDECNPINPCLNGGVCLNFPGGRGFQCTCPPGFYGKYCNAQRVGKELQLSNAALIMIICFVNVMSTYPFIAKVKIIVKTKQTFNVMPISMCTICLSYIFSNSVMFLSIPFLLFLSNFTLTSLSSLISI